MGETYSKVGDCYLPNLTLPGAKQQDIGRFGLTRQQYLKTRRKGLFAVLLTGGKQSAHFYEIVRVANECMELLTKQTAKNEGVTKHLKVENQLLWIQRMTNIRNRAKEIIREEPPAWGMIKTSSIFLKQIISFEVSFERLKRCCE